MSTPALQRFRLTGRPVAASLLAIELGAAVTLASQGLGPRLQSTTALGAETVTTVACQMAMMNDIRVVVGWMAERRLH